MVMQRVSPARHWERAESTEAAIGREMAVRASVHSFTCRFSVSVQMYRYEQGQCIEVLSSGCKQCAPHGQVSPRSVASVLRASPTGTLCAGGTPGGASLVGASASPSSCVHDPGHTDHGRSSGLAFFFFFLSFFKI